MNRKKRRDFNKSMKSKTAADEMIDMNESIQQIASMSMCNNCKEVLDKKNDHHLDNWRISVVDEKMILLCDSCQ
tara:strand:+ start:221 stop:442 length:222 start_codon:yes stop_codon:yes gene_type:complete